MLYANCSIMYSFSDDLPPYTNSPMVYNVTDSVQLLCQSDATPYPLRYYWNRNGSEVDSDAILQLDSIQRDDAGVYECCTLLQTGPALCTNVTITVQCECRGLYVMYLYCHSYNG